MFGFFKTTFSSKTAFDGHSPSDGMTIQVGDSPTRTVHIPESVLNAHPMLSRSLSDGSTIINTDPVVFEIALEYLSRHTFLGKVRPLARCPLEKLVGGSDMMLKLAKAWHLAAMLELPRMQNKLIDVFSASYRHFVESRIQVPLCREPFNYLRDHMGHYSKCEKFMVDFHAGLARRKGKLKPEELKHLPDDVARVLQQRRAYLAVRGIQSDRVARGDSSFKTHKSDRTVPVTLHVRPSFSISEASSAASSQSECRISRSIASLTTMFTATTPGSTVNGRGHHSCPSLPLLATMTGNPERAVQRTIKPALWSTVERAPTRPPPQPRSTSMPLLLSRAPFAHPIAVKRRPLSAMVIAMEEDSSSDEEDYDIFAPDNLFMRKKPRQVPDNMTKL